MSDEAYQQWRDLPVTSEGYWHWRKHGGMFDLSSRTMLRLTGPDRVRYLNGQVTANVKQSEPGRVQPACVTTAKGKLSADIFITATELALYIDAERELRESLLARLERYIVADDVLLEDITDTHALFHFIGPPEMLRAFEGRISPRAFPQHDQRASRFAVLGWDFRAPRIVSKHPGVDYQPAYPPMIPPAAGQRPSECPPQLVELVRIEAGIPRWGHELTEDTLPPEAGLDRTHIDYAKGCYIGQEVISRIKSVGHVNRRLSGFISTGGEPLQAGWSVFAPGDLQKAVGELTSAAWSFALAKPVALGYLRRGSPSGALLARPADGATPPVEVTPAELPLVVHFPS